MQKVPLAAIAALIVSAGVGATAIALQRSEAGSNGVDATPLQLPSADEPTTLGTVLRDLRDWFNGTPDTVYVCAGVGQAVDMQLEEEADHDPLAAFRASFSLTVTLERAFADVEFRAHVIEDPLEPDVFSFLDDPDDPPSESVWSEHYVLGEEDYPELQTQFGLVKSLFRSPGQHRISVLTKGPGGERCYAAGVVHVADGEAKELHLSPQPVGRVAVELSRDGLPLRGVLELDFLDGVADGKETWRWVVNLDRELERSILVARGGVMLNRYRFNDSWTDAEGRVELPLPPGRWRVIGVPTDGTGGRAESIVTVRPGQATPCPLPIRASQPVRVHGPGLGGEHTHVSAYGPPGLRILQTPDAAVVEGLFPGDEAVLVVTNYDGDDPRASEVVLQSGVDVELGELPLLAQLELELSAAPEHEGLLTLHVDPLETAIMGPYEYLGPTEEGDMTDLYRGTRDEANVRVRVSTIVEPGQESFELLPQRYRITLASGQRSVTKLVTLRAGELRTEKLHLGK